MPPSTDLASSRAAPLRGPYLGGLALAAIGAVFFSGKAVVAKLMYQQGIDAVSLIALRMLISLPFFAVVALWTWRQGPPLSLRDVLHISVLGLIGYYGSSMFDFMGLQYITAGLERLILFLTPTFVLLIGLLLFKKQVSAREWMSMLFAYAGIVLVFWHDVSLGGSQVVLGAGCVLVAAVLYAIYLLYSGELLKRFGTLRLVSLAMLASSAASLGQYALLRPLPTLFEQTPTTWGLAILIASLCTVLPVFLTMMGVARIGAGNAAQAGMIGPVSTLFLAWWLLAEPLTSLQLTGTALVMTGIFLLSTRRLPAPSVAEAA